MDEPQLRFLRLRAEARPPRYAHEDDAGFDLFACEEARLEPGQRLTIPLGLAAEIPRSCFVSLRDRSGLAGRHGLHVLAGVIDAGYRGEWKVVLVNLGRQAVTLSPGQAVAQGIVQPCLRVRLLEVQGLSESERGQGGFGSTDGLPT